MSDLNILADPPSLSHLLARARARFGDAGDRCTPDYRATRRDWSDCLSAQAYVEKVRALGRQLVSEEVEALNDALWYREAVRYADRAGFGAEASRSQQIAA